MATLFSKTIDFDQPFQRFFVKKGRKMEKCNFLKILPCPDFENSWGDFWHLSQPKKLDKSDGGFCFLRIIFSSHVQIKSFLLWAKAFEMAVWENEGLWLDQDWVGWLDEADD